MADKPAKAGDPGFDASKLLTDDDAPVDEQETDEQDEHAADDELSLDELDAQLRKALQDEGDADDDEPAGDEPAADDVAGRLAKTEAELKALKKERRQNLELEERKAAGREILAAVKELHLTRPQLERTVTYFRKRPDLEGVVPFREAALLVNPSLSGDRVSSPDSGGRNGSRREESAQVITHRGGGPAPKREAFKPSPNPGNYSNVTAAILADGNIARKLIVSD
jgi:hypothetical protein